MGPSCRPRRSSWKNAGGIVSPVPARYPFRPEPRPASAAVTASFHAALAGVPSSHTKPANIMPDKIQTGTGNRPGTHRKKAGKLVLAQQDTEYSQHCFSEIGTRSHFCELAGCARKQNSRRLRTSYLPLGRQERSAAAALPLPGWKPALRPQCLRGCGGQTVRPAGARRGVKKGQVCPFRTGLPGTGRSA